MSLPADRRVVSAFAGVVLLGGSNLVLVVYSTRELAPLWGAGLRFSGAAAITVAVAGVRRLRVPRGRAFALSLLYGVLAFFLGFALFYWGAQRIPAGIASVVMGSVPLLTFVFALVHGLERFRPRGFAGACLAIAGIAVVSARAPGGAVPLLSLLAVVGAAAAAAEAAIVIRKISGVEPFMMNAIGMASGAVLLVVASLVAGESHALPGSAGVAAAVIAMAVSTPFLFALYVFVVRSWSASAAAYQFVLFPLVSIVLASLILDEALSRSLLIGAPLVLMGVYVGALAPERRVTSVPVAGGGSTDRELATEARQPELCPPPC